MKAIFGIVSLLVALAIVGILASKQLKGAGRLPASAEASSAAAVQAPLSAREQSQQMQNQVRDDLAKALEQGAARRQEADK